MTGAAGFTGSHLAARLAELGAEVRGFVRVRNGQNGQRPVPEGVEVFEGDLRDAGSCREAIRGMDTVFHVAGVFRSLKGGTRELERVHVEATEHLVRAAADSGCRRLVHTSTVGVHGHMEGTGNEESPFRPGDAYQETKLRGELKVRELAPELDLPFCVVRPGAIYGPGDRRFLKLVRPIRKRRFIMVGSGRVHYHFCYVDDLVEGLLLAGEKEAAVAQAFLIGGEQSISLRDLVRLIARVLEVPPPRLRVPAWPLFAAGWLCEGVCSPFGIEPPLHRRRVAFFTKHRSFDIGKARNLLGYKPKTSVEEGFRRMIAWYAAEGDLD